MFGPENLSTFAIYEFATGKILRTFMTSNLANVALQLDETTSAAAGEGKADLHYVLDGVITDRPALDVPAEVTLAVGETHVISGLPEGCICTFGIQRFPLDGELELSGDMPSSYEVKLECFPYLDHTLRVTVE